MAAHNSTVHGGGDLGYVSLYNINGTDLLNAQLNSQETRLTVLQGSFDAFVAAIAAEFSTDVLNVTNTINAESAAVTLGNTTFHGSVSQSGTADVTLGGWSSDWKEGKNEEGTDVTTWFNSVQGDVHVKGSVKLDGFLEVLGGTSTFESVTVEIKDNSLHLSKGNTGDTVDQAIFWEYKNGVQCYRGLGYDAVAERFKLFESSTVAPENKLPQAGAATNPLVRAALEVHTLRAPDGGFLGPSVDTLQASLLAIGATNATAVQLGKAGVTTTAIGSLVAAAGLSVTGDITVTGDVDGVDISALESTVGGHTTTLGSYGLRLDTAEQDIDTLESTVGGHTTTLGSYGLRLDAAEQDIDDLEALNLDHAHAMNQGVSTTDSPTFVALTLTSSLASNNIHSRANTAVLVLSGGGSGQNGANIELYGSHHGSYPNRAYYDADMHTFRTLTGTDLFQAYAGHFVVKGGAQFMQQLPVVDAVTGTTTYHTARTMVTPNYHIEAPTGYDMYLNWFQGNNVRIGNGTADLVADFYDDNVDMYRDTRVVRPAGGIHHMFEVRTSEGNSLSFSAASGEAAYNALVQAGDARMIYHKGVANTGGFVIAPWSSLGRKGIRMNASGDVGIHTDSPQAPLHVAGDGLFSRDTNGRQVLTVNNQSAGTDAYAAFSLQTDSPSVGVIFKNSTTRTGDGGVNTMTVRNDGGDLRLQAQGGTGITVKSTGTTEVGGDLEVKGGVKAVSSSFPLPDTGAFARWVELGRITLAQGGNIASFRIVFCNGYNANLDQNLEAQIFFKTSNGISVDSNGFAGDASVYYTGRLSSLAGQGQVRIVANAAGVSATSFKIMAAFLTNSAGSYYIVESPNGTWEHIGAFGSSPGNASATVLEPVPEFRLQSRLYAPNFEEIEWTPAFFIHGTGASGATAQRTPWRVTRVHDTVTMVGEVNFIRTLGGNAAAILEIPSVPYSNLTDVGPLVPSGPISGYENIGGWCIYGQAEYIPTTGGASAKIRLHVRCTVNTNSAVNASFYIRYKAVF